jgi:peptide/nickel transport system substrate-binding protein
MRKFVFVLVALMLASVVWAEGDQIRSFELLSRTQAEDPTEFQAAQLVVQEWRKLGLDVEHKAIPWEQLANVVWFDRDPPDWDMTMWRMVGRPERSDPDELIYNLFHSSTAEAGYNFIAYSNPEYDAVVEAQRVETDPDARQELIIQAQEILDRDQPNAFLVHPQQAYAYRSDIWDPSTVVEQSGIGIKNFWTFVDAAPLTDQTDMILNSQVVLQAINPLYISGATDSWVTELIWDRLLRISPEGLAEPWAAESFTWVDDTTIDVTLRSGMQWHDGEPVTVEDVVFSFRAPLGDEAPMYKPFVSGIADIAALDESTVRFTLTQPSAAFLTSTLAKINLVPLHIWGPILDDLSTKDENAESYQEEIPIGSGPFKYVNWLRSQEVVLEANTEHFSAPEIDRWILRIIPNSEASLGMLRSGELNFLSGYLGDPQVLVQTSEGQPIDVVASTEVGFRYVAFNHRAAPFDDPAFRRALSMALNRNFFVQAAYKGFAEPSNSPVSTALGFWSAPGIAEFETGIDLAKEMLAEAGYTVDRGGSLHYPDGVTEQFGN